MLNSAEQRLPYIYDHTAARALPKGTTELITWRKDVQVWAWRRSAGQRERLSFAERLPEGGRLVV